MTEVPERQSEKFQDWCEDMGGTFEHEPDRPDDLHTCTLEGRPPSVSYNDHASFALYGEYGNTYMGGGIGDVHIDGRVERLKREEDQLVVEMKETGGKRAYALREDQVDILE